jgi:hypothetical protein
MSKVLVVLSILTLLVVASVASAGVTITAPSAGQVVGPSTAVTGSCSQRAFLVVYTDVNLANGDLLGTVAGIRHWTNDDNSFSVLISTPRLFTGPNDKLTYIIHVKAYSSADKTTGDPDLGQAQVTCYSK